MILMVVVFIIIFRRITSFNSMNTASPIGRNVILVILYVETFITNVIVFVSNIIILVLVYVETFITNVIVFVSNIIILV
jgi:hypothetical protein